MSATGFSLREFVRESNRIEGITKREPSEDEIDATGAFADLPNVHVADLEALVTVFAPGHRLRDKPGMNVRVGRHIAPVGRPQIRTDLEAILARAHASPRVSPFAIHLAYENLHPFTDGNGRSGRALWLWMMGGIASAPLGFLHHFYYQTLEANQR